MTILNIYLSEYKKLPKDAFFKRFVILFICISATVLLQAQVFKTVSIAAGGLYPALSDNERSTITKLVVTGTIDARDFAVMRDSMPVLSEIDISNVNIASYVGTAGTYFPYNPTTYQSNKIPQYAFCNPSTSLGKTTLVSFIMPGSVIEIGTSAFYGCRGLLSINIPMSVVSINGYAFGNCRSLTSMIIPASVTYIGKYVFATCTGLRFIDLRASIDSIPEGTFYACESLPTFVFPPSITIIGASAFSYCNAFTFFTIPSSVTFIGDRAFSYCQNLVNINIPPTVTSLGNSVLQECPRLATVTIPPSIESVGNFAFFHCYGLKSMKFIIPASDTSIGTYAFYGCDSLTAVTIPSSVNFIGAFAFGCARLKSIYAKRNVPVSLASSSNVFATVDTATCTLYVPAGYKSLYDTADQWKRFSNIVEITISNWTGSVNNSWENPANWSTGMVPTSTTDVYIDSSTPPVFVNSNVLCFSLNVASGTNLTVGAGYSITVVGP